MLKKTLIVAVAAAASLAGVSAAQAYCPPGFHHVSYGGCRRDVPLNAGAPVIGIYYNGQGYWDGHRYWGHRDRFNGGWRYH